jgi:methylated-DNA-[protein]-cysteine S-methyltransferase
MIIEVAELDSPIGPLTVAVHEGRLCALEFGERWQRRRRSIERRVGPVDLQRRTDPGGIVSCLEEYFAGRLDAITTVTIHPWGTPFQLRVWTRLRDVPAGRTTSYGDLARSIGAPAAVRAVGAANGANPIAIVVPCHRVIAADGSLSGYAGGLERKRWLLRHERLHTMPRDLTPPA